MWFAFPLASYFMYLLLRVGVIAFLASYLNDQNWLSDTIIPPQRFLLFQRIGFLCVVYPYCHSLSLCPAPFQSFCCLHTGFFLHLELLAEMSALQANEKEADRAELSPCFPRSVLAFLWKFGLGTNFLEFGGTPGFWSIHHNRAHKEMLGGVVKFLRTTSHSTCHSLLPNFLLPLAGRRGQCCCF